MRRLASLVLALSAVALGLQLPAAAAPAAPAHTGLGIALLDGPANLVKDPRSHIYVIDHVVPGTQFTRHVQVTNDTGAPAQISLYSDAAVIKGGSFVPQTGHTGNDLTSWMTVTPTSLHLAQGERATVAAHFAVPTNATGGERYGVIFAEIPGHAVTGGFSVASRVGIRVYLDVSAGAAPRSDFRITTLTAGRLPDGRPTVSSAVQNTGGRALDMSGQLWLRKGPGGLSAGPFPVQLGTTLGVGQTEPVRVVLDKSLPAGPWLAHLELQSDLIRHAAEATITFPATAGTSAAPVPAKAVSLARNRNVLIPVALGLIALALIGLILFFLWRRRRRDDDEEERGGKTPPVVPAQRGAAVDRLRSHR